MSTLLILFAFCLFTVSEGIDINQEETDLYYYGLEESERSLPRCVAGQACAARVARYWRRGALVRLCRCGRRTRCDTPAPKDRTVELNNRAHLQFCHPVSALGECAARARPLTVRSRYDRMNPDDLELLHHQDVQLTPPNITLACTCRTPNYWKLHSTSEDLKTYQCSSLPLCSTGEFCGNVNYDLNALYQSCLCPKRHMCVHNGGVTHIQISEVLYEGKGWKAYCSKLDYEYSYEDY